MIYLTRSKTCIGKHISLFSRPWWRTLTWKVKNDPQGPSQIPPGQEVERLRALNVSASRCGHSTVLSGFPPPHPDQQPQPETFKRQKLLPSVKNKKAFIEIFFFKKALRKGKVFYRLKRSDFSYGSATPHDFRAANAPSISTSGSIL